MNDGIVSHSFKSSIESYVKVQNSIERVLQTLEISPQITDCISNNSDPTFPLNGLAPFYSLALQVAGTQDDTGKFIMFFTKMDPTES